MHLAVMAGEPERHGVAEAARDGGVLRGQAARRLGETDLVAGEQRAFGGVGDFEVAVTGDRANANGHRPLERLGRRLALLQPTIACPSSCTTLAADSGSSAPMARW